MMVVRAANSFSVLRCCYCSSSSSPSFSFCRRRALSLLASSRAASGELSLGGRNLRCRNGVGFRYRHSLFESVMEELEEMRTTRRKDVVSDRCRKRVYASIRTEMIKSKDLVGEKFDRFVLRKGSLVEFRKDADRIVLGVAQEPDGKKNWMVSDQNGAVSSVKPQQITFIVPGIEDFLLSDISSFIEKSQNLLDPTLLEYAWEELREKNKSVTAEELAEIIYGSVESLESYCAHLLLSKEEIYFTTSGSKGISSIYKPRPPEQVKELLLRKKSIEAAEKEFEEFIRLMTSAIEKPVHSKPPKCYWTAEENTRSRVEALDAYAIDMCKTDDQKKLAFKILKAMRLMRTSSSALNLLIGIGYFPVHVNLDLLKLNVRTEYSEEILLAADEIVDEPLDQDERIRKDLTFLKVYAIDVDEADELDDALSAERMPDGRIKIWIHVADPACLIEPGSMIDKEAMRRSTSVFLPTGTFPMFPQRLAMESMSLKQGDICRAVSVSVILNVDGSISDYMVENSIIRPTYMLTYESATELLYLNLGEEEELRTLYQAASLRTQWRHEQGAINTATIDARIKVANPDDPEPLINLYVENQADPAMRLVSEMMFLCGEAIATFGSANNIPLPYRGQPQSQESISTFSDVPEGPARSAAFVKVMRAAEMDYRKPIRHGVLGLPGYVQFTSPIRRYVDLLAHYQVKAFLRGDLLPFSVGQLEGITSLANVHVKIAKRLCNSSLRYWLLEYLRRQPKEKKFRALVLRFIKDRVAALLMIEVGVQTSAAVSVGVNIGDEVHVQVKVSHPRDDILSVQEV